MPVQAIVPSFFTEIVNPADADAVADVILAWRLVDIADAVLVNRVYTTPPPTIAMAIRMRVAMRGDIPFFLLLNFILFHPPSPNQW
jgi:hypothetical protein